MKIWNLSIKQPVFMSMILVAGIVLGLVAYTTMPVTLYPDVEFPVVVVKTIYPGAGPQEVEDQITAVLEDQLTTVAGLDSIESTSAEGVSTIVMQFDLDLAVDAVTQDVRDKVNLVRNQLPDDIYEPIIQTFDPDDQPILSFSVADTSGRLSLLELRDLAEEEIQNPLERIPDVSAVEVSGGQVREIQVNLDVNALQSRRISPQQVTAALQAANINLPGGAVEEGDTEFLVRTPGDLQTLDDIRNVIVADRGAPIYLRDVAQVVDGFAEESSVTRLNGENAIVVQIRKTSGSNTIAVAEAAKEELAHIAAAFPNLDIAITSDQSRQVQEAADGALEDLLYAALLASLVMLFFFRDLRNTLVTIAGLPVIMIATLFFMNLFGIGLNQISLLALALVVGLVIDDGIVVRENILRWVEKGYSPRVAASLGTAEVALPVIAIGATILAVFMPVAFAEGMIGKFFLDFGLTVSIAMVISMFEAVTMAPMLSAYIFKKRPGAIDVTLDELDRIEEKGFTIADEIDEGGHATGWLNRSYAALLDWTLRHKLATGLISLAIIVASFASVTLIEVSFLPGRDATEFNVAMSLPGGTPLHQTAVEAIQVEGILAAHPAVAAVVTQIGGQGTPEAATFTVVLKDDLPRRTTAASVMDELRGALADVPGLVFSTGGVVLSGSSSDIVVEILGTDGMDYNELGALAAGVAHEMAAVEGLVDLDVSYKPGRPEFQIDVDRGRAADLGLSTAQIASTVRLLVNGDVATTFRGEGTDADIRIQLAEGDRSSIEDILNLRLLSSTGQLIPLRNVAQVTTATGPNAITRSDRRPYVAITANVVGGRSVPSATAEVEELMAARALPAGVEARLGGDAEAQVESFTSLLAALGLGVIFIYMVLASQFGSLLQPLLIMLAMPLAIVGAILALLLSGRPLDMTAMIGFIMLMGLVVKNSVLLVDFANRAHRRGASAGDAMRIAGPVRLRPILMTSFAMILAMIPISLGLSAGGEFRQPMAIAILGGMVTSTLLTLVIVPLAYAAIIGLQDGLVARRARRRAAQAVAAPVGNAPLAAD